MNFRLPIIIIISVFIFSSCADEPVACFNTETDTVEVNETVLFTNCSTNSDQYEWEFGDSVVSTDIHPKHFYNDTGIYIVELIAFSDLKGKNDKLLSPIIVIDPSEKFISNYLITWENSDALLTIEYGLTSGSMVLSINSIVFCNASAEKNILIIDSQNYWNDDFLYISHGEGILNGNSLIINIIVVDHQSNESIIQINAEKVAV